MFKHITCYSVILDDPTKAGFLIDEAIEALKYYKQPVYLELPRDIAEQPIKYDVYRQGTPLGKISDKQNLDEALTELKDWIESAENPVIMAGVQVSRFELGQQLVRFAHKHNIPMVTTLLSKSTVNEKHPLFAGVYSGSYTTQDSVRKLVDDSDCLMIFGELLTDMTLGFQSPKFTKRQTMVCSVDGLKIKNHSYDRVNFVDFCELLFKSEITPKVLPELPEKEPILEFIPEEKTKITTARFFQKIDALLAKNNFTVIADIGECLFSASELTVQHNKFFSPAFYCSMGSAIPGALGVQLASKANRPIVLVGDGAFQMSISELSTLLDYKLNPIVFVLNNRGYTTERFLLDGKFNDIRDWDYHKVTQLICGGYGIKVETESDLEDAVNAALNSLDLFIINVVVDQKDISPALRRMSANLAKRVKS